MQNLLSILSSEILPAIIVFDLDCMILFIFISRYIMAFLGRYTYISSIFERNKWILSRVLNCDILYGDRIHKSFATFYKDVPEILLAIHNTKRIDIAIASRTEEPEWAKEIIELVNFSNGETLCINYYLYY